MDQTIKILILGILSAVSIQAQEDVSKADVASAAKAELSAESSALGDESRSEWLAEMKSKLPMVAREIGPFGLHQIRSLKPVVAQQQDTPAAKDEAFSDAIDAIKVNAVIAPVKFIIGAREFRVGDRFPIARQGRTFKVKVISVKSSGITLQNIDSKELALKSLTKLPAGMTSGSDMGDIKGVQRSGGQTAKPLTLE